MDKNFENWDQQISSTDWEQEMKTIRKSLRRRNRRIILTSVVLVIALLFGTIQFGMPALEKLYWVPDECTYLDNITDLELTMNIYNELFGHGKHFAGIHSQKRGFADYALEVIFVEYASGSRLSDVSYRTASLTKGRLSASSNFWLDMIPGIFPPDAAIYSEDQLTLHQKRNRDLLRSLPDYVQVHAAVTFSQDLTMEQLQQLQYQYSEDARFLWTILRCSDPSGRSITPCGMHLTEYRSEKYEPAFWKDTPYPSLFVDRYDWSPEDMETHITSMLQFSRDQAELGKGFLPTKEDSGYYQQVLSYFEENGVKAYGCYLIATPQVLLEMLENGTVWYIDITDARIGF